MTPAYPPRCPVCGERVYPLELTSAYRAPAPPADDWHWEARCWLGHLVQPLPDQLTLF
jgi:hypothetical protein